MRFVAVFRTLGVFLMVFSISMLPPIGVGLWYHDGGVPAFLTGFIITWMTGFLLWIIFYEQHHELKTRDGFLIVSLFWIVLSIFGAVPLMASLFPNLSMTDAVFESVSGLTTTGATVMSHLDTMPHAILYYRQQLHLLGGIGIIVLAVAVMPMLGIGGMQLYRAEIAGPIKTTKLTPRITHTAKALWLIYCVLAAACAFGYWLAGMTPFDAIGESFSTVSTGGFSIHDSSFAYYHNPYIDAIAIIFMILGTTNFALHFQFLKQPRPMTYFKDPEFRFYMKIILFFFVVVASSLCFLQKTDYGKTVLDALFTVVSLGSTTGLTTDNFSAWPLFLPYFVMVFALVGGCAGSTSGGLKVIRCLLLREQGKREFHRLIHPNAVLSQKLGQQTLSQDVIQAIWAFVALFFVLFIIIVVLLLASGLDFTTAYGSAVASLSNAGVSIGATSSGFEQITTPSKWVLIFGMLAGRLEIFTLLVLFMPAYWRR